MNLIGKVNLYRFANDPELFSSLDLDSSSWFGWNVFLKFYSKIPLNRKEQTFFNRVTNLSYHKEMHVPNKWLMLIGRGGGKTRFISRILPYRALTFDEALHPGQKAENITIAPTMDGGMTGFEYAAAMIEENSMLYDELVKTQDWHNPIVKNRQQALMRFSNKTTIELKPVNRIAGRGKSIWTLILEEAAHFKVEGRFSDEEIYRSAKPAMKRFGSKSMCFIITTPWTKEGLVWKLYRKWYGQENPNWLIVQGSSQEFNPKQEIEEEEKEDMDYYRREYLAQFVDSIYGAFPPEAIEDATVVGRRKLEANAHHDYFGFVDSASLSLSKSVRFNDEYVAGVAHCERNKVIIDALRAWKAEQNGRRYTPDDATASAIQLFKSYNIHQELQGDKFASGYVRHKFVDAGFRFKEQEKQKRKTDIYLQAISMFADGAVELLDDEVANTQLKALERKRGRDGKDRVDHARDKHDDRANVICGLVVMGKDLMSTHPPSLSDVFIGNPRSESVEFEGEKIVDWREYDKV